MTEHQVHELKMHAHAIFHIQRENSLGNKAWGAQSSTLLQELLAGLAQRGQGEVGGRRRGGTLVGEL